MFFLLTQLQNAKNKSNLFPLDILGPHIDRKTERFVCLLSFVILAESPQPVTWELLKPSVPITKTSHFLVPCSLPSSSVSVSCLVCSSSAFPVLDPGT